MSALAPLPLRARILGALRLSSMSCLDLSWCVSEPPETVGKMLREMRDVGDVVVVGHKRARGNGRPWNVWGLAA